MSECGEYPKQISLDVRQQDIDSGVMNDACRCPLARAAWRTMVDGSGVVFVSESGVSWEGAESSNVFALYPMTKKASRWVARFDAGWAVKPVRLQLRRAGRSQ